MVGSGFVAMLQKDSDNVAKMKHARQYRATFGSPDTLARRVAICTMRMVIFFVFCLYYDDTDN